MTVFDAYLTAVTITRVLPFGSLLSFGTTSKKNKIKPQETVVTQTQHGLFNGLPMQRL